MLAAIFFLFKQQSGRGTSVMSSDEEMSEQSSVLSNEEDYYSDLNGPDVDNIILPYSYEPDDSQTSSNGDDDDLDDDPERLDNLQW